MAAKKKAETAPLPEGTELPESVAELPEIISVPIPPELWEQIRAEQAKAVHWRDIIDRVTTKKKTKSKAPSEGWQERRALPIMRALWPPHGLPPVSPSQKAPRLRS